MLFALQLLVIYLAFFVDWLSYTLFAFWLLVRLTGGYFGLVERWSWRRLAGLTLMPVSAFTIYLCWRLFTPDSITRTEGVAASIYELAWKVAYRMNLTDDHHVRGFLQMFVGMHDYFYSPHVLALIVGATLVTVVLLAISFRVATDPGERRSIFATASMLFLVTMPFYAHMLLFYQHTTIHQWAIGKAMFTYALVPFALLPISLFVFLRLYQDRSTRKFGFRASPALLAIVLAGASLLSAEVSGRTFEKPYLIGNRSRPLSHVGRHQP